MGAKTAFNEVLRRIRAIGTAAAGRADGRPVFGPAAPETWTGTPLPGRDDAGAGEKIIRAGLVVDEWDGTVALLSRRG
jgi:hypothetical protein